MAEIKWFKVAIDMFEDSKIEFIRSLPEGDSIIVTWLQMLSIAGKSNADGYLMITDGIPYTEQLLCNALRRNPVFMQFAIQTLTQLKMVNVEDGPFHITKWEKHQNVEKMGKIKSDGAIRQQRYRDKQRQKQLLLTENNACDVTSDVTSDVTNRYSNAQEVRSKNKEIKDIAHPNECAEWFSLFWNAYPNKKGKKVAEAKWNIYYRDKKLDFAEVMEGTAKYVEYCKAMNRTYKDGATFINQRSWEDDWTIIEQPQKSGYVRQELNTTSQLPLVTVDTKGETQDEFYQRLIRERGPTVRGITGNTPS